jgi:hypothetical protein
MLWLSNWDLNFAIFGGNSGGMARMVMNHVKDDTDLFMIDRSISHSDNQKTRH